MSFTTEPSRRVGPVHGILLIMVAAILWELGGAGSDNRSLALTDVRIATGNCLYQVFEGEAFVGSASFHGEQHPAAILARMGLWYPGPPSDQGETIPCNSCTRILPDRKGIIAEPMKGSHLISAGRPIDVNRASAEDLTAVPGIGPELAKRIVETRDSVGSFRSIDELKRIRGMGRKRLAALEPYLQVTRRGPRTPVSAVPVRHPSP